ncbi:MAG: hypothetical protein WCD11_29905 [Solirubrobacteraceae bacterium]
MATLEPLEPDELVLVADEPPELVVELLLEPHATIAIDAAITAANAEMRRNFTVVSFA